MCECCDKCCECFRKVFLFITCVVNIVGSIGYCFYLIWLLAHLKDNNYYWFMVFIPVICGILALCAAVIDRNIDTASYICAFSVGLTVMCAFPMLTRLAYYHLSPDDSIGPKWIIMSLKASIIFFISAPLAQRRCRLQEIIKKDKDVLSRGLLDFVDIFELAELLSLNSCVGVGSSVTEMSSLEMAIQAFCVMSFVILWYMAVPDAVVNASTNAENDQGSTMLNVYFTATRMIEAKVFVFYCSLVFQNLPFLILRIIFFAKYEVFSLGLMIKNLFAIVICCAEIMPWLQSLFKKLQRLIYHGQPSTQQDPETDLDRV